MTTVAFAPAAPSFSAASGPHTVNGTVRFVGGAAALEADGTPRPGVAFRVTSGRPGLALYDAATGRAKIRNLDPSGFSFRYALSDPGSISFSLSLDDAATADVTGKRFVKASWHGRDIICSRIEQDSTDLATNGRKWRKWANLPGALDMTRDIIVFPEYGQEEGRTVPATSSQQRTFGWMSLRRTWYIPANWTRVIGVRYSDDTGYRKGKPGALKSADAWWIAKNGPYAPWPSNEPQWLRKQFTTYSAFDFQLASAFDDDGEVWLDGEQILGPDAANRQSYNYLATYSGTMKPGLHVLAVENRNGRITAVNNAVAFIAAIQHAKPNGDLIKGPPFLITNEWWYATGTRPYWRAAEILGELWEEGRDQNVPAAFILHPAFTDTHDSSGVAFTDTAQVTVDIGRSLLELVQQFCEHTLDVVVDAHSMGVRAYKDLGIDRSATVFLKLGDGEDVDDDESIDQHTVDRVHPRFNSALVRLADGSYIVEEDAASIAANGRAQIGLSVGSTPDDSSARQIAQAQFDETANTTREFTVELSTLGGPQPWVHFFLGDSVSVPDEDGTGWRKVRVMAILVDATGDVVRVTLEVAEDRS